MEINLHNDAVRYVKFTNRSSKRLASMALHQHDLRECKSLLDKIEKNSITDIDILQAIFTDVLIDFMRCFEKKGARDALDNNKVFQNKDVREVFEYFHLLRNKFVAHDENTLRDAVAGIVIDKNSNRAIDTVLIMYSMRHDLNHVSNFVKLIDLAIEYVKVEILAVHEAVLDQVNLLSPQKRAALQSVEFMNEPPSVSATRKP